MTEDQAQELREALRTLEKHGVYTGVKDSLGVVWSAAEEHVGCLEVSDEMVEAAAKGICAMRRNHEEAWKYWIPEARAAVEAAVRVHTDERT